MFTVFNCHWGGDLRNSISRPGPFAFQRFPRPGV